MGQLLAEIELAEIELPGTQGLPGNTGKGENGECRYVVAFTVRRTSRFYRQITRSPLSSL